MIMCQCGVLLIPNFDKFSNATWTHVHNMHYRVNQTRMDQKWHDKNPFLHSF
jgi:hypothetical protein